MHEYALMSITIRQRAAPSSPCAVDPEHPSRLAHVQNDLMCQANRVQHRTADSAQIGGSRSLARTQQAGTATDDAAARLVIDWPGGVVPTGRYRSALAR